MRNNIPAIALSLALSGCAAPSLLHIQFGAKQPPATAPMVSVQPPSAAICKPIPPQPVRPYNASIPQPSTPAQVAGFQAYLSWLADAGAWAREGWATVAAEQKRCQPQK